jgi:hypothetical protein
MASLAARSPHPQGQRLLKRPVLLRGTRRNIAELLGWILVAVEVTRLLRRPRP